jgi:hypothetical protein
VKAELGWRLDPAVTFLNHGSYGACPEPILEAQRAWRDRLEAEPVLFLSGDLPGLRDEACVAVGRFLGADPEGSASRPSATTSPPTTNGWRRHSLGGFAPADHGAHWRFAAADETRAPEGLWPSLPRPQPYAYTAGVEEARTTSISGWF